MAGGEVVPVNKDRLAENCRLSPDQSQMERENPGTDAGQRERVEGTASTVSEAGVCAASGVLQPV